MCPEGLRVERSTLTAWQKSAEGIVVDENEPGAIEARLNEDTGGLTTTKARTDIGAVCAGRHKQKADHRLAASRMRERSGRVQPIHRNSNVEHGADGASSSTIKLLHVNV